MSSRITGKPPTTRWRRPMTRTYDYNTALGENYYKPQLDYISTRRARGRTPPSATTFAERLLKYPPSGRSTSASRRGEESELSAAASSAISSMTAAAREREASMNRYSSLDDLGLDEDMTMRRRRQLFLQSSRENLADDRGLSPLLSPGGRNRVTFGDKMLDAVGVKESGISMSSSSSQQRQQSSLSSSSRAQQLQSSLMTDEEGDAIDKILNDRRNRRQAGISLAIKSADADLFTEDPLKSPQVMSSRMQSARQQMDDMREEMRRDSDASTSKFRQRLRAKREQEQREEQNQQLFGSMSALDDTDSASSFRNAMSSAKNAMASSKSAFSSASKNASSTQSASSGVKFLSNVSSSAQNLSNWADDDDVETAAILSKVEQIRKRAKARMAALNDDFPDLQIESSLASRRAASRQMAAEDEFDSDYMPSSRLANSSASSGGNRSVTISKRTIKSSYDLD